LAERLPSPRVLAVVGLLVVVAAAWLVPLGSWVTRERGVITANPGLRPYTSVVQVPLDAGEQACVSPVPFEERTAKAIFAVVARRTPAPVLEVTAEAPGYRAQGRATRYPTTGRPETVEVGFPAPGRDVVGRVCWRNAGATRVELVATDEQKSVGPAETRVEGEVLPSDVQLVVAEPELRPLTERPAQLVDRVAAISGGLPRWGLWVLLAVVLVGFPAGAAYAVWRSFADAGAEDAPAAAGLTAEPEPSGAGVPPPLQHGPDRPGRVRP
jgi:hypothetical protein